MAEYLGEHFVAALEQMGDFEVVEVDGRLQKRGGNVVSYFCTPDGRVLHFVVGPVSGSELLRAATWAVDTHQEAFQQGPRSMTARNAVVRDAHLAAIGIDSRQYQAERRRQSAHPGSSSRDTNRSARSSRRDSDIWHDRIRSLSGPRRERVHRFLAEYPLPMLGDIRTAVFRRLANERVNNRDGSAGLAADQIETAQRTGRPVLLVLYRNWDSWRKSSQRERLRDRSILPLLNQYTVVNLPLREVPALSSMVDIDVPNADRRTTALLVLVTCDGKRTDSLPYTVSPTEFADALRRTIDRNHIARAEQLTDQDRVDEALRLLAQTRHRGSDAAQRRVAGRRFDALSIEQAQRMAAKGNTAEALRLLRQVQRSGGDESIVRQAAEMIAELNGRTNLATVGGPPPPR